MTTALARMRRTVVITRVDAGDDTSLCALADDGEMIRVAVNSRVGELAIDHARGHIAHGFDLVQVCSLGCPG